jgi:ribosomal protein S14
MARHDEQPWVTFIDSLALVYHEARNVRHLVKEGHLPEPPYRALINLPVNRFAAWRELQPLRIEARDTRSGPGPDAVFRRRFGLSLVDLREMYGNPGWKDSKCKLGGNAWAAITEHVIGLRDALAAGDMCRAFAVAIEGRSMDHNTGPVQSKLRQLDESLLTD